MFFRRVLLLLIACCVHQSRAPFSYPKPARIAIHTELPWHAVLLKKATKSMHGAVVASRFYLLTVCKRESVFRNLDAGEITYSNIRVLAGSISVRPYEYQGAQVRWIYYWEDHPKCRNGGDGGYRLNDISVIKVTQMFIFNSYLQPMPFERDQAVMKKMVDEWISNNKTCTFAGFGGYRFKKITIVDDPESPYAIYDPVSVVRDYECCISKHLRVIEMRLMSYDECLQPTDFEYNYLQMYLQNRSTFCAAGVGSIGNSTHMTRTGMVCDLDFGSPIECKRDDGKYLVIGHASFMGVCTIRNSNLPQGFTRYDWVLHDWIKRFHSTEPFGDHWVDADYNIPIEFCNDTIYSGPIPPKDIT